MPSFKRPTFASLKKLRKGIHHLRHLKDTINQEATEIIENAKEEIQEDLEHMSRDVEEFDRAVKWSKAEAESEGVKSYAKGLCQFSNGIWFAQYPATAADITTHAGEQGYLSVKIKDGESYAWFKPDPLQKRRHKMTLTSNSSIASPVTGV
jgi:hypothetical protein